MHPSPRAGRAWTAAAAALALLFALLVVPAIVHGGGETSEQWDQDTAHLPVIRQFAAELPQPNIADYASATGPGLHLLLAPLARLGASATVLRLASALFGLALVLVAWKGAARCAGPWRGLGLVLPLACCSYLIAGSIWITTDALALLLASSVLALAAWNRPTGVLFAQCALLGAAAITVRQTALWAAAPIVVAGVLGSPLGNHAGTAEQWRGDAPRSWRRLGWALLAVLAMAAVLAGFVALWGGLTPPMYRVLSATYAVAAPAFGLALVGMWGGAMLLPDARGTLALLWRHRALALVLGAVALIAALVPETSFDREAGRWGGPLWMLVQRTPRFAARSVVLAALAVAGALVLLTLWLRAAEARRGRFASVIVVALLAMMTLQIGNKEIYERYQDPMILLTLAWLAAMGAGRGETRTNRLVLGACMVALGQLAITAANTLLPVFRAH